jgi:hypothetical protein
MHMKIQNPKSCWICGRTADSSEHRIKKTDLVRAYGRGPYMDTDSPVHVRTGVMTPIQGPNSNKIKYAPSLCHSCNTTGTQPYDEAYEALISWLFKNEQSVLRKRFINFSDVYGHQFESAQSALYKYFVKSFGCRLVEDDHLVPHDLIKLLPLDRFLTNLRITFCVNEDILLLPDPTRHVFIGKGNLYELSSKSDPLKPKGYIWNEHVSWFTTCYWYNEIPDGNHGSTWTANSQHIYLGSVSPILPEQRIEFISKY